jgi:CTP:molybdopterin cytidylyltransferase MocA
VISGLVLAAGEGRRFGGTKQLAEVRGLPLVLHAVEALRAGGCGEILVVTGHDAEAVESVLPGDVVAVRNAAYRDGQSTSLAAGIHAVGEKSDGTVVLMADQPGVREEDVRALIDGFARTRGRIVRLMYDDGPGPALLSREIFGQAGHLHGDTGARILMASHPEWVEEVRVAHPAPRDVDEPADLDHA